MELRRLSLAETKAIYQPCLARDFPPDELMPWDWMEPLIQSGRQVSAGFYDERGLAAYAVFILDREGFPAALLNYFAVEPDRRDQGIGGQCLRALREAARSTGVPILFEVESPEHAHTPEERGLRQRRVGFYQRNGALITGVDSWLFGVDYHIMLLPPEGEFPAPDDRELAATLERLYHVVVPAEREGEFTFQDVCRVSLRQERGEPGHFTRELGRALTFLFRGRKKFMNESLKQYDLSGAMYMILLHAHRHPGASQDSIANHMYLDKCTVARRTKKLEELGYLTRETDRSDRRQNNLYLTPKGEELAPVIRGYLHQWGETSAETLTDDEKLELLRLLAKMTGQGRK